VGSEVVRLLAESRIDFKARSGANLVIKKIAVRNPQANRPGIDPSLFTTDAMSIVNDPEIDVIIELMGGIEPAHEYLLKALNNGKAVITANKALLARHGDELETASDKADVDFYYEAAVAGAIPIIRPLSESLIGDYVTKIMGIVNGTTNFILTKMFESGADFDVALKEAQSLGFAEADPTADVEGFDAAAKAAILATLAFHHTVTDADVYREGITKLTARDIAIAKDMGMVIKLLAIAENIDDEKLSVRVHPTLLPETHPLASVRGAFNAVFVEAEAAGELMFYGRGAGGVPTASAVLGDLVAIARNLVDERTAPETSDYTTLEIASINTTHTRYLIRLDVLDRPGVLAGVANVFAANNVSISTVRQTGQESAAELTVTTHLATEESLAQTVKQLNGLDFVKRIASVIRVEGLPS
jgi:homoserine dehydrogenase